MRRKGVHVVVTREEMALLLPAGGRYRVRIQEVRGIPEDGPREIELLLRIVPERPSAAVIRDRFPIRGNAWESLMGMGRLLQMLSCAGVRVLPDTPMDLGLLVGLELLVDIKREVGWGGFPYVRVVGYYKPAARLCDLFEARNAITSRGSEGARDGAAPEGRRTADARAHGEPECGLSR